MHATLFLVNTKSHHDEKYTVLLRKFYSAHDHFPSVSKRKEMGPVMPNGQIEYGPSSFWILKKRVSQGISQNDGYVESEMPRSQYCKRVLGFQGSCS